MVAQLITALQALAADADAQPPRLPDVVRADGRAPDFDDALLLIRSCPQVELAPEQSRALAVVESLLERMSSAANGALRTEAVLRHRAEWTEVRAAAAAALRTLGYPIEPPPPASSRPVNIGAEPPEAVRESVLDGLRRYNRRHADPPDFRPLALGARDGDGSLVGGLVGETGWQWLHVDLLWVDEGHRGRGIGRRLLRAAEAEAAQRGCRFVYLDTFEFQARQFYEHEGYSIFGLQEDYPPGSRRYYFRKALTRPADHTT
jgi:GNAT superfamily N-acetyltransferase